MSSGTTITDLLMLEAQKFATFEGVERKGKNWFAKYSFGNSKYRWQMPDEATARRVETAGSTGGGMAFARRKAIRSYRMGDDGKWKLLRVKNSKKYRTELAARRRVKRFKRKKRLERQQKLERLQDEQMFLALLDGEQGEES